MRGGIFAPPRIARGPGSVLSKRRMSPAPIKSGRRRLERQRGGGNGEEFHDSVLWLLKLVSGS
jgi:hypothetical protein